jgi:5-methylcytosine-specific restriction endonuclease McrA
MELRQRVMDRDRWVCQVCGAPAHHVDHKEPVSKGGADTMDNLRALCAPCNLAKGAKTSVPAPLRRPGW